MQTLHLALNNTFSYHRNTLFGEGIVAHVSFAHPVALELTNLIADVAKTLSLSVKCSVCSAFALKK